MKTKEEESDLPRGSEVVDVALIMSGCFECVGKVVIVVEFG